MNWDTLLSYKRLGQSPNQVKPQQEVRSSFERDFDRILFSNPFRSLQDKTQVLPLPEDDFVHTRLTHSLETSSVGKSLGKLTGTVIIERHPELKEKGYLPLDFGAIVSAACLSHDLGNPPFGHSGESAISNFFLQSSFGEKIRPLLSEQQWHDLVNFEGNAQGFRILATPQQYGMKLTYAVLAAFIKYPKPSHASMTEGRVSQKKFGFFESEKEVFHSVWREVELVIGTQNDLTYLRHPLAFLVEAADNICYHIIDLEDATRLGYVGYKDFETLMAEILSQEFKPSRISQYRTTEEKLGVLRALVINKLTEEVSNVFLNKETEILYGSFDRDIFEELPQKTVLDDIIKLTIKQYYRCKPVLEIEASGFEILHGLLEKIVPAVFRVLVTNDSSRHDMSIFRLMPEYIRTREKEILSPYQAIRLCLDFVSGLSDKAAVLYFKKMKGLTL